MDPIVGGALIGGAASLLGGMFGRRSQEKQVEKSEALQREFAKSGIQWRVEDAKAAGLHPLYALGASTSGPAIPIMEDPLARGLSEAGQNVGRAVAAGQTDLQRLAAQTALNVAGSQIARNYAEAAMFDSQAARNYQAAGGSAPMPPSLNVSGSDPLVMVDPDRASRRGSAANLVKVNPSESTSYAGNDPSVAAAGDVTWKRFRIGTNADGSPRYFFGPNASNFGEAMESVSESLPLAWIVARENLDRNPNFLRENAHWFPFGKELVAMSDEWQRTRRWMAAHEGENWRADRPGIFRRGVVERLFNINRR